ncbi:MAG TPA: methyltransferase [Pseudonocardiaceae bacterium]
MSEGQTATPSVLEIIFGYGASQVVNVTARLGLADHLASGVGTTAELAAITGTDELSMHRLLRTLVCLGMVTQSAPDWFTLAPAGEPLRADVPYSLRQMAMLVCGEETWRSWGELEYSVRTGRPAYDRVTGLSSFEFLAKHPDHAAVFNQAMAGYTRAAAPAIIANGRFDRFDTLVDVGGGDGTLLAAILGANPGLRGMLYDLPAGVESADRTLSDAGVADRCDVTGGDFFVSVPEKADAYLLKSVLHDWNDERAVDVLRNCRRAMTPTSRILVVEPVLPPMVSPELTGIVLSDLNMLVNTGGRERTEDEFRSLFTSAGLELNSVAGTGVDFRVLEGSAT